MTINIGEGETFIKGRSREVARELLERAVGLDIDTSLVRTTSHGYIVPSELLSEPDADAADSGEAKADDSKADGGDSDDKDDEFDPSAHTVAEINDYLPKVDEEERNRVLAAERAGKNRAAFQTETNTEGAK